MSAAHDITDDASERFSLIEMDPLPGQACKRCKATGKALDGNMLCMGCFNILAVEDQRKLEAASGLPIGSSELSRSVPTPVAELARELTGSAGIFERPRAERAFVVGPKPEEADKPAQLRLDGKDLIAGAVAEGHGVIVSWGGTATTRGQLLSALETVGLANLAPNAASPEAHAGEVIERLNRSGYVVRKAPARKVGERVWTAASLNHTSQVGDSAGDVLIRFTLRGDTLTYDGPTGIGDSVVETFKARMAAERYKAGDVTTWLGKILRQYMRATRFGLGWYVPQRHAELTTKLCEALSGGFGSDWITGLPVASSDQLRKGIARGLIDEVKDLLHRLDVERQNAAGAKQALVAAATANIAAATDRASMLLAQNELHRANAKRGDIGDDRIKTFLSELRTITERVVAYGRILGEEHLGNARNELRDANVTLETLRGEDHSGIRARFDAIFEELAAENARKAGGVL